MKLFDGDESKSYFCKDVFKDIDDIVLLNLYGFTQNSCLRKIPIIIFFTRLFYKMVRSLLVQYTRTITVIK